MTDEGDIYGVKDRTTQLNRMIEEKCGSTKEGDVSDDESYDFSSSIIKLEACIRCIENGEELSVSNIRKEVENVDLEQIVDCPKYIVKQ